MEEDVIQSIKMLKPLGAGYEVINVKNGKMVCNVVKELDQDQAVVLAESRAEDGRIVEETLVIRRGWTRERARTALENMLLRDGLCWLDTQDELHRKAYWVPSAMRWDDPSKVVVVTPSTSLRCKWYGGHGDVVMVLAVRVVVTLSLSFGVVVSWLYDGQPPK